MLSALLRNASVTALMLLTACQFSSAPSIGQSSASKKKGDAGSEEGQTKRRVVVAKPTPESDAAADAEIDAASAEQAEPAKAGAGGKAGSKSTAGSGGSGAKTDGDKKPEDKKPEDKKPEEKDSNQNPPADKADAGQPDAGAIEPVADGGLDAGARPMVDNPIGVLEGLASRSPGGRTATTINRFLETIAKGDAPASSIKEFLVTINEEMMCEKNPFATECLAACQAVSTTCWDPLESTCRHASLSIL